MCVSTNSRAQGMMGPIHITRQLGGPDMLRKLCPQRYLANCTSPVSVHQPQNRLPQTYFHAVMMGIFFKSL